MKKTLEELKDGKPYYEEHIPSIHDEILKKYLKCEIPIIIVTNYYEELEQSKHQVNEVCQRIIAEYSNFIGYLRVNDRNKYLELFPNGKEDFNIDDVISINEINEIADAIYKDIYEILNDKK
jgi:hypothetical protein